MTEIAKNLVVEYQWNDGAYKCIVDIWNDFSNVYDEQCHYTAREGDPAPINLWILGQIATGIFNPIATQPKLFKPSLVVEKPKPTLEQLQAQLATLTAQITALANTGQ
jgi:hypothetical protein